MRASFMLTLATVLLVTERCSSECSSCDCVRGKFGAALRRHRHHHNSVPDGGDVEIDYVLLVMQNAAGYCATNRCSHAHANGWGIHGLWPSQKGTMGPSSCNNTASFNIDSLSSILDKMRMDWPSLVGSDPTSFWHHEWCKHGTCAVAGHVDGVTDEFTYFSQTLSLFQQHNIPGTLAAAGIKPSDNTTYTLDQLMNAFSMTPKIDCDQSDGRQILVQVRMCYSVDLQLIDCQQSWFESNDEKCDPEVPVSYLS